MQGTCKSPLKSAAERLQVHRLRREENIAPCNGQHSCRDIEHASPRLPPYLPTPP